MRKEYDFDGGLRGKYARAYEALAIREALESNRTRVVSNDIDPRVMADKSEALDLLMASDGPLASKSYMRDDMKGSVPAGFGENYVD